MLQLRIITHIEHLFIYLEFIEVSFGNNFIILFYIAHFNGMRIPRENIYRRNASFWCRSRWPSMSCA